MKTRLLSLCLLLALALLPGCAYKNVNGRLVFAPGENSVVLSASTALSGDEIALTLSDGGSRCEGAGVSISGSVVTIREGGDYLVTGSLSDGQLVIDAPGDAKVTLLLNGVSIRKQGHAALWARSADKLVLKTVEGSENLLQSKGEYKDADKVDAAVYAACDLTLDGSGALNISSHTGHALYTKEDCKLVGGTVNLEAALKGLYGKDSVTIDGGILNVDVGTDAICASNASSGGLGRIKINGGVLNLLAQKDGLDAAGDVVLTGGVVNISAGSGKQGMGVCADGSIELSGGELQIVSVDDALHAFRDVELSGGTVALSTGDDGVHAGGTLRVSGGVLDIAQSYEGLEGQVIEVSGGTIRVLSRDDGFNAAGGHDASNDKGVFGADRFSGEADALILISGGTTTINAEGDGVDSNGYLRVTGGALYISGPSKPNNGALDFGIEASITGGTVIAAGAAGMAENFGPSSTQGSILLSLGSAQNAGSTVSICDEKGTILAYYEPEKSFNSVVISTGGMNVGGSYSVIAGTELMDITLEELIVGTGSGWSGRGHGGSQPPDSPFGGLFRP